MGIYGRLAPALEAAMSEYRDGEETAGGYDDDDGGYYNDMYDDPMFQVHAITSALIMGFLYHVGFVGLVYRFFIRDRLHVRIWQDLRSGVELTPEYGLHFNANNNDNNNNRN